MKIRTTRFGEVTIDENAIIQMPHGMLGFPERKQFVVFAHKENSPFFWFQSVDDPDLAFVITNPCLFEPDYRVDVEEVVKAMPWDPAEEKHQLETYVVVNIPQGAPDKMTANLIGPLVLHATKRQAVQVILIDSEYTHKYPLIK